MKNLILIRHAKSSWDGPVNDKDRHISNIGMKDAHLISTNVLYYLPEKFIINHTDVLLLKLFLTVAVTP